MLNKRRNLFIICLSLLLVLSLAGTAFAQPADVKGHWAEKQISDWVDSGLIKGYPDGTFKPDNSITRAEFVVLANKACGYTASAPVTFTDVKTTDWYYGEVARAVAAGYISGYTDGTFKPNGEISRQEAAVIIARIQRLDTTGTSALGGFKDAEAFPEWSRGSINAVAAKGYMKGYPDQTFQAPKSITRAEAVVTLDNSVMTKKEIAATYNKAGTYGPETGTATIEGNAVISAPGVTLQNTLITGDLLLAEGIGDGDVTLKNVTVKGNTTVKGGGAHSVNLENCTLPSITVSHEGVRVVASGSTIVNVVTLESGATLVEMTITGPGFETVVVSQVVPANAPIVLTGSFTAVEVNSANANIQVPSGSQVKTLTLNAAAVVTGQGTITTALVNTNGSKISATTTTVTPAPNVSVTVGNTKVTADATGKITTTPATPGGGGGGGGAPTVGDVSIGTNPVNVDGLAYNAGPVEVTLSTTDGASIYYTTDSSIPTALSTPYTKPFTVNNPGGFAGGTVTVKAIGIKPGYNNSAVAQINIVYNAAETVTAKVKFSVASSSTECSVSVGSDYEVKAVIPKDAEIDPSNATIKLELTDIASLGISGTRSHELTINTGIGSGIGISLDDFLEDVCELSTSTIKGKFGDNEVTYALSRADTADDYIWVMKPSIGDAQAAWQYLVDAITLQTFVEDNSRIIIPQGAYLAVGNQKLKFKEIVQLDNLASNFSDKVKAIRDATELENSDQESQIEFYIPSGTTLKIGQSRIELNSNMLVKISGLEFKVEDLNAILPNAQSKGGIVGMITGSLDIFNQMAKGMKDQEISICVTIE